MPDNPFADIRISFSDESLLLLNLCLAFIMFGVSLDISPRDFRLLLKKPKAAIVGLCSQFLLLPALTFLLILVWQPHPALAMGMLLVACCPGGNVSNFVSSLAGANVALSVGLTALATLVAPLFTPANFRIWSGLLPETGPLLSAIDLNYAQMFQSVMLLLALPLAAGMLFAAYMPNAAARVKLPVRVLSFLILLGFIGVALAKNIEPFQHYLPLVFALVLVHNLLAFSGGYLLSALSSLSVADRSTVTIETGIQNSGLGLIIIFNFFDGNGAMALVAAWWGVWHIIAGVAISLVLKWQKKRAMVKGSV